MGYNVYILTCSLLFNNERILVMIERRKDNHNRILKDGEHQRANGTYEYKYRDKKGKRHSVYAKTLSELREKEINVLRNAFDGVRIDGKDMTINDLYNLWVQLKRGLKGNTFQNYQYMYRQFVEPDFGRSKICDLKRTDVRAFYNYLHDTLHLKTSTIDCIHNVLHQVIDLALEDEYIRYNPADKALKELKRAHNDEVSKRHALTVDQQNSFENFLYSNNRYIRWYPIFVTMLWTGMRVGEITGLRWSDISLDEGVINVSRTLVYYDKGNEFGCSYAINTTKTNAGNRLIPILPKVKEALKMEKQYQEDCGIKCNATVDGYTDFVFVNRFGNVQNQATLNKALKRIIRDYNYDVLDAQSLENAVTLPPFSNHSLRHTFATRMCEANVNIKAIQDILGHADIQTTMNIYAEATKDLKCKEMISFNEFFQSTKLAQTVAV